MKAVSFTRILSFISFAFLLAACNPTYTPPNILLIVTDDQAYGDLSFTGNPYLETPVLDKLAHEGAFANHFYVSPVCAPTRASLLTGRYHQHTGVSGVTRGRENMDLDETTMADVFKSLGYQTGIFGKWHNGAHYPYHPMGRGFDSFTGFASGHWGNYFNTAIEKDGEPFMAEGYLVDLLTNEAITFMEEAKKQEKPFFCYLPYQTPHTPLQVPDKYFEKYKQKGLDDFNACIYGMCENIDDNIGRLLQKLDGWEIRENTIIIFLSDNGPLNYRYNTGLKGKKGMVDEGGVRVPFIINWAGKITEGKVLEMPLAHIDILPTLLDLAQGSYSFSKPIDGVSFAPQLKGNKEFPKRILFSGWAGKKRALSGNFLMVDNQLYDIKKDPGQTKNIHNQFVQVYDSLLTEYNSWYNNVTQKGIGSKPIPVGYDEYPVSMLPAHEATLFPMVEFRKERKHTGIAYHSKYGWAHDWIGYWTNTEAYAQWEIDIIKGGAFDVELNYALAPKNKGVELVIEIGTEVLHCIVDKPFEHATFINHDRVQREQEAPETDWGILKVGSLKLDKGQKVIKVKSIKIPGQQSIELKSVMLSKKSF